MIKRAIALVGIALAGVAATALPANAAAADRTASFGTNGSVTMGYHNGHWTGSANFVGLSRGHYVVYVSQFVDYDHDGIGDGGVTAKLCEFNVRHNSHTGKCKGVVKSQLLGDTWADVNQASVDRITHPRHNSTVSENVLNNDFS